MNPNDDSGFGLAEFLISSVIVLVIAASVFGVLSETQRTASYQSEIQSVLQNTRIAMSSLEKYIRQAANDPRKAGFTGVTVTSATEIRLRTDITGSSPVDKGDPDGDTNDAGEDITITYDATSRSIEMIPKGGTAQQVADHISAFSMTCYDANGAVTNTGAEVRKIRVSVTGTSAVPNPQTGQTFSQQLTSDIQLSARN